MIDADKYEGHTQGPWHVSPHSRYKVRADENLPEGIHHWHITQVMNNRGGEYEEMCKANAKLIAAAPELLAEVKRLRKQLAKANKFVHSICQHTAPMMMDSEDYIQTRYFAGKGDDEE